MKKMKIKKLFFVAILLISAAIYAQEDHTPSEVITGTYKGLTIPLRDFPTLNTNSYDANNLTMIINESSTEQQEKSTTTIIQNLQTEPGGITAIPLTLDFRGFGANESGGYFPPDPTGAAGPDHYVHAVNNPYTYMFFIFSFRDIVFLNNSVNVYQTVLKFSVSCVWCQPAAPELW